ncbi:hypothetical protein Ddye_020156 [Dipteronia dyeriana]|uniref:SHSP domain-containing protein n=1 Tax=Dipteronia dyeriana TaxID=168575 RepID=A0AAD9U007_9ROSI|nr:hypothetical protein Ddye_020156 [Dipteronia dyeriana]
MSLAAEFRAILEAIVEQHFINLKYHASDAYDPSRVNRYLRISAVSSVSVDLLIHLVPPLLELLGLLFPMSRREVVVGFETSDATTSTTPRERNRPRPRITGQDEALDWFILSYPGRALSPRLSNLECRTLIVIVSKDWQKESLQVSLVRSVFEKKIAERATFLLYSHIVVPIRILPIGTSFSNNLDTPLEIVEGNSSEESDGVKTGRERVEVASIIPGGRKRKDHHGFQNHGHGLTTLLYSPKHMDTSEDTDKSYNAPTRTFVRDAKAMVATPAVVREYPNSYVFVIDMPGLKSDDIKVQVEDDNVLTISGERKRDEEKEGAKYVRMERRVGKFMRKFVLPD